MQRRRKLTEGNQAAATRRALENARYAIQHGKRLEARRWAEQAVSLDKDLEEAWLILAAVASRRASLVYLHRALEINPDSARAQAGLKWAEERLRSAEGKTALPMQRGEVVAARHPTAATVREAAVHKRRGIFQRAGHQNWPLVSGATLILIILLIAIWGPRLAPHDPLESKATIRVGEIWLSPPFAPLRVPGYPLGSDTNGRDVFSQLLWAVRPTLIMVTIVALVRLMLGLVIGLIAGWAGGAPGRIANSLLAGALAVPVLIVSLAVIAAVGIDLGVWAFILGLSASGWAETARLVRDQTILIQQQPFIEAARALGVGRWRLLFQNTLRHITPMLPMLLAFEVSGTLLVAASLGFLGYYIGGEVWTPISDTAAARSTGIPELGMMLATLATDIFISPWKMIAAGTVIFITILGFNLLGEGLRLRLAGAARPTSSWINLRNQWLYWLEERLLQPFSTWKTHYPRRAICLAVLGVGAVALVVVIAWQNSFQVRTSTLPVPGNHLWGVERHDPYGTLETPAISLRQPEISWMRRFPGEFSGGPVVSSNGQIFIATRNGIVTAITPNGTSLWPTQVNVPAKVIGSPALSAEGRIYITDSQGGLNAISPLARMLWRYSPEEGNPGGNSGPIVDAQGNIYYACAGQIQALTPDGQPAWINKALDAPVNQPPSLAPQGDLIFLKNSALSSLDGNPINLQELGEVDQLFTGGDGRLYARYQNNLYEWQYVNGLPQQVKTIEWDWQRTVFGNPRDAGVTSQRLIWLLYYTGLEDARLVWLNMDGVVLSNTRFPLRDVRMIAVDGKSVAYVCGAPPAGNAHCLAISAQRNEPLWDVLLPESNIAGVKVTGGALADGVLYVALQQGILYALGEARK